jgi:hypothetical protein
MTIGVAKEVVPGLDRPVLGGQIDSKAAEVRAGGRNRVGRREGNRSDQGTQRNDTNSRHVNTQIDAMHLNSGLYNELVRWVRCVSDRRAPIKFIEG